MQEIHFSGTVEMFFFVTKAHLCLMISSGMAYRSNVPPQRPHFYTLVHRAALLGNNVTFERCDTVVGLLDIRGLP